MHSHLLCTLAAERSQELRRASASTSPISRYVNDEEPFRRIVRLRIRVGRLTTRFAEMRS